MARFNSCVRLPESMSFNDFNVSYYYQYYHHSCCPFHPYTFRIGCVPHFAFGVSLYQELWNFFKHGGPLILASQIWPRIGRTGRNPNHYPGSPCGSIPQFAESNVANERSSAHEGDEGSESNESSVYRSQAMKAMKAMKTLKTC